MSGRCLRLLGFPFFHELLELRIVEVDDVEPELQHVVHAALAVACPHARVGIPLVGRRVVVDADDVEHRARGQQRRHVVRVEIRDVPVEVEVIDRAQHGHGVVEIDRLERQAFAAHVHVRLERVDARRLRQTEVAVVTGHGVRRDFELVVRDVAERNRLDLVLRHEALRIEHERHLGRVGRFLAVGEVVHVEAQARSFLEQAAGALVERVTVLADRVLVEVDAGFGRARRGIGLDDVHHHVMHDAPVARTNLHGFDVAILREGDLGEIVDPPVRALLVHRVRAVHRHDKVGLADVPRVLRRELPRGRHVRGISLRRSRIDPFRDGGDFSVVQRDVVLVFPDAHRFVEVPRWHLAVLHARFDRARPGTRVLVGDERHGRAGAGMMAVLALGLEDRRDVFRERHRRVGGPRASRDRESHKDRQRHDQQRTLHATRFHARHTASCSHYRPPAVESPFATVTLTWTLLQQQ